MQRAQNARWAHGLFCDARQVQEASLKWKVGVAECTCAHLGPALLPFKARLSKVIAALFAAPSKVSAHTIALQASHTLFIMHFVAE